MNEPTDAKIKLTTDLRLHALKKMLEQTKSIPVIVISVSIIGNDAVCDIFSLDESLNKNDLLELIEAAKQIILRKNGH